DPLLKIFAGDRLKAIMDRLKLPEGEPIEAGMVSRSIESAQRKVEARNFDIRKQLLEYDDVANDQRKIVYADRNALLESEGISERIADLRHAVFTNLFRQHVEEDSVEEQWDMAGLQKLLETEWQLEVPLTQMQAERPEMTDADLLGEVLKAADSQYQAKVELVGEEAFAGFERSVLLQTIDQHWREHLSALDFLRQGIHLRGYAQKNPKQEYKREAFELFGLMQQRIRDDVTRILMMVRVQTAEQVEEAGEAVQPAYSNVNYTHADFDQAAAGAEGSDPEAVALAVQQTQQAEAGTPQQTPVRRFGQKVGRNDPCPCGSGKKYKQCHGKLS
ncbi:MAG: SEC-C metal-binding domain-containing protein, partial [Burkholderiaceae bacterium]